MASDSVMGLGLAMVCLLLPGQVTPGPFSEPTWALAGVRVLGQRGSLALPQALVEDGEGRAGAVCKS